MRGSSGKVNLAVDRLPEFSSRPGNGLHLRGDIAISPSVEYLERAYDDAKYGRFSRHPYLNVVIPSVVDPSVVLGAMPGLTRNRVVEGLPALSQPEVAADVTGFFAEHPLPEASRALEQKLELLDANVKLRERETAAVTDYFS
jgi:phytoene dehydrogenase-like protein